MTNDGSSANGSKPSRNSGRIVWIVMIVSLMINAFLIGAVAGRGLGKGHEPFGPGQGAPGPMSPGAAGPVLGDFAFSARAYVPYLDKGARRELFREMRAARGDVRSNAEKIIASRNAVIAALRAEPFDQAAFEAALTRASEADAELRKTGVRVVVRIVAKIPAERRAEAAEAFEGQLSGRIDRLPRRFKPPGERLQTP